jgi:integrase
VGDGEFPSDAFVLSLRPDGSRPWQLNWLTKRFILARRGAGLPRFRLHDLRHFMASQMLAAGVPLVTVSQRLSHARTSTTLNVYAHSVPEGDREAAETLAAIIEAGREAGRNLKAEPNNSTRRGVHGEDAVDR